MHNPLCCYYKTRKPLPDSAHRLIHTKSATPCVAITKRGSPCDRTHALHNEQALVPKTLFLQNKKHLISKHLKSKITTENSYFEYCKWYNGASFHYWKSVLDCSLLRYHQLNIKVFTEDTLQYFSTIFTMEDILAMVVGPRTSEITTFDQIDHNLFKEFLTKSSVWEFYETSKE